MAYTDTIGALARAAEVTTPTVAKYARLGLLDYIVASNGTRLFRQGQAARVREIYTENVARRGRSAAA